MTTNNPSSPAALENAVEVLWQHCTGATPATPETRHLSRSLVIALEAGRRLPRVNDKTQGPLFSLDGLIEPSADAPHLSSPAPSHP